eukprot:1613745-Lingulodinium_polyedra.AAC.1
MHGAPQPLRLRQQLCYALGRKRIVERVVHCHGMPRATCGPLHGATLQSANCSAPEPHPNVLRRR